MFKCGPHICPCICPYIDPYISPYICPYIDYTLPSERLSKYTLPSERLYQIYASFGEALSTIRFLWRGFSIIRFLWRGFSTKDYARDYAKYPVFFVYDSTPLLGISLRPNSCGQMPDFDTVRLSTPSGKWSWS